MSTSVQLIECETYTIIKAVCEEHHVQPTGATNLARNYKRGRGESVSASWDGCCAADGKIEQQVGGRAVALHYLVFLL